MREEELREKERKLRQSVCPKCGKIIYFISHSATDYAWKLHGKYYCSYGCYRIDEKEYLSRQFKHNYIKHQI